MRTNCRLILFALSLVSLLTGCGKQAQQPTPTPPTVSVIQPIEREVVEWDEYTGRLESPESVEVRARVNGYLDKVHFKEGKEVKKGDLLFTIDRRPYQAEFDRAEADHQRAESQTELAKSEAERAKRLIATKAISEEDFDTKTRTYASARASVRSAKAALDSARLNLEFTEIHAPIAGRIGRSSYYEVLEAQQELYPTQRAQIQSQIGELLATIQLYKALGGGWQDMPK